MAGTMCVVTFLWGGQHTVSMESGLDGRNNLDVVEGLTPSQVRSQWSPA